MLDFVINFAANGLAGFSFWGMALFVLVATQLTIFTVTLYLHRSQTHRGVDFHPLLAHFFRFWSWLTTGMVTREWVAIHRKHHAKCETEDDPHSPQVEGINKVMWQGSELYREASKDQAMLEKFGRGCPNDWIERHLYSPYPFIGVGLMMVIDLALFGVFGLAIWGLQMLWIPIWAAGVVNGLGHWCGYRNFETTDQARNLLPWGFWVGGEELHNNHHAFPSSAKFALRRFEFDIGWVAIRALSAVRLAKVLRVAPSLDVRADVALPDNDTLKAVLTHRFRVMKDFSRGVIKPVARQEARREPDATAGISRRMRRALGNGGRWLDIESRERLAHLVERRPQLKQVCEYRDRLVALMNQRRPDEALKGLQQWIREAEQSRIEVLEEFAHRLKGYAVAKS